MPLTTDHASTKDSLLIAMIRRTGTVIKKCLS